MENEEFTHLQGRINDIEKHLVNLIYPIQKICELFKDNQKIEHLIHLLSKPIMIDDSNLHKGIDRLSMLTQCIEKTSADLDIGQTLSEIKYIENRLQGIENDIRRIRIDGIRKNVCVEVTLDGHELEKTAEKKRVVKSVKRKRGRPRLLK